MSAIYLGENKIADLTTDSIDVQTTVFPSVSYSLKKFCGKKVYVTLVPNASFATVADSATMCSSSPTVLGSDGTPISTYKIDKSSASDGPNDK